MIERARRLIESGSEAACSKRGYELQMASPWRWRALTGSLMQTGRLTRDRSYPIRFLIIFQGLIGSTGLRQGSCVRESSNVKISDP